MIADRDFERVISQAKIKLTGASEAGLKAGMFDVLNEFIGDSNCWTEWLTVNIVPNVQDYRITPKEGGMVKRLVAVFDANKIGLPAMLPKMEPPSAVLHLEWPQNINIVAKAYVVKDLVLPTGRKDIPDAPDWLFPMYGRYILEGILGHSMNEPAKSYSNQAQSGYHLKRFRDGIAMAKTATMRANLFGGQAWRFPGQFRTTSQRGGVSTPFPTDQGWG
jgi:hypothetical protein